jgi:hypothetical protein
MPGSRAARRAVKKHRSPKVNLVVPDITSHCHRQLRRNARLRRSASMRLLPRTLPCGCAVMRFATPPYRAITIQSDPSSSSQSIENKDFSTFTPKKPSLSQT